MKERLRFKAIWRRRNKEYVCGEMRESIEYVLYFLWRIGAEDKMMENGLMMGTGGAIAYTLVLLFLVLGIAAFVKYLFFHRK